MNVVISNISIDIEDSKEAAFALARKRLGVSDEMVLEETIVKRSVDARKKGNIRIVYSVGLRLNEKVPLPTDPQIRLLDTSPLVVPTPPKIPEFPPVVVGFGPAGMFCALLLARQGCQPIVLERGEAVEQRAERVDAFYAGRGLNPESNIQFGEGGAGTFSDGKLVTRIGDPRCSHVLQVLAELGAPEEILWEAKPHIGTDNLRKVVAALRQEIIRLGGQVRFNTRLDGLILQGGRVVGVRAAGENIPARQVVLAVGHSSRDTFTMLLKAGLVVEAKAFSVGVRIEHLQHEVDKALYGDLAGHPRLPKGEYQLSYRDESSRGVYTFCMCPGGYVVPAASYSGGIVTNGMSFFDRGGLNANAALVASVDSRDYGSGPLAGVVFQQMLEERAFAATGSYQAPIQTVGRFIAGKPGIELGRVLPTYEIGTQPADFSQLFPDNILQRLRLGLEVFGRQQPGFNASDAVLTGPETRTSSPVRFLRGENLQAIGIEGLYPCGEGAGYAGGITSAAVDGIRVAQQILNELCG